MMKNKKVSLALAAAALTVVMAGIPAHAEDKLTVWTWDPSFNIYSMQEAEKIYQQDHPDFSLDIVEVSWDDTQTKLGTILSSGNYKELPDILLMQDFAFQKYVLTFPDLFVDLTDSGIDFSQFAEGKTGASMVDGKNYGVPFDNGADIAAYRLDILEQAGYTEADLTDIDWNRFIEIGKEVKEKTGYSLFSTLAKSSDLVLQMVQSAGGTIWDEDGAPYLAGNEILLKSIEVYKEMFDTGVMATSNSWDEYVSTFTTGKTLGVINGCWIMASIETAEDTAGNWRITNIPSLPDIDTATNYSNQGGSSWGITTNCQNLELAQDFLNSTFAGSVELYETILPGCGALSTWTPAAESDVYAEPNPFYGDTPVFESITKFASNVIPFETGIYYVEANNALATAMTNICAGGDVEAELQNAEDTIKFDMGM